MTGMSSTSGYHAENLSIVDKTDFPGSQSLPAGDSPRLSEIFEEELTGLKIEDSEDLCSHSFDKVLINDIMWPEVFVNGMQKGNENLSAPNDIPDKEDKEGGTKEDSRAKYPWETHDDFVDVFSENHYYNVMGYNITAWDINTLAPGQWLTDAVIDSFVALTSDSTSLCEPQAAIFVLDSLAIENATMGLQSIFKKAQNDQILFNDVWLVPTHVHRNHWILIVVLIKAKTIIVLDPLYSGSLISTAVEEHVQITRLLLSYSHSQIHGTSIDWDSWKINMPYDMGVQSNSSDCGLCVCVWVHSICTGTEPPLVGEICASSMRIRNWIRHQLLSKAQKEVRVAPPHRNNDNVDHISKVYFEFDEKLSSGELIIERPWLELPSPLWSVGLVDGYSTANLLGRALKNLWRSTEKFCGAEKCLKVKSDMYRCEACPEYYHLVCIGDKRKAPAENQHYICPQHSQAIVRLPQHFHDHGV
ncbi:Ubiquitin-like-specific protease 1 [Frankliniella fusca]|uniref:Ubiquitin-like-specific protease 1 n=1 Tax=Frankliniella fusca TaxID=407009 RepID=A0AAE1LEE2_9NEOP|nr:Ubiquitin-like-specific protease 1 [Frankliniella fusca]